MLRKEVYINKNVIINNKKDFYKLYKKKNKGIERCNSWKCEFVVAVAVCRCC